MKIVRVNNNQLINNRTDYKNTLNKDNSSANSLKSSSIFDISIIPNKNIDSQVTFFDENKSDIDNDIPNIEVLGDESKPNWDSKKKGLQEIILKSGLEKNNLSLDELNSILKSNGITKLSISSETIKDPKYFDELKNIQQRIGDKVGSKVIADGAIGKNTISALKNLDEARQQVEKRSQEIVNNIEVLGQVGPYECHDACFAGNLNYILNRTGDNKFDETHIDDWSKKLFNKMIYSDFGMTNVIPKGVKEAKDGSIEMPKSEALKIVEAIDKQLETGLKEDGVKQGVIVGVSYRKWEDNNANADNGITDHWVVITGRGKDEEGVFYNFNDTIKDTETGEYGVQGKLRFDPFTGLLKAPTKRHWQKEGLNYTVSRAKPFTGLEKEDVEKYQKLGMLKIFPGQSSDEIALIRYKLSNAGYEVSTKTRSFDKDLTNISNDLQKELGIDPIGVMDTNTISLIDEKFNKTLKDNSEKVFLERYQKNNVSATKDIQSELKEKGFYSSKIDGDYGGGTEKSVKEFQKSIGVESTGKIDGKTWLMLIKKDI